MMHTTHTISSLMRFIVDYPITELEMLESVMQVQMSGHSMI